MKTIGKRLFDLCVKLISVKTIPAVIFSIGYIQHADITNGALCLTAWALVIGVRYAEKVHGIIKAT